MFEGVAFAFRDCRDALAQAGSRLESAAVIGGGSAARAWVAVTASILGIPLTRVAASEHGAALGAARLGRIAATREDPASVCTRPPETETIEPDTRLSGAYDERHATWRRLYPALRDLSR